VQKIVSILPPNNGNTLQGLKKLSNVIVLLISK